MTNEQKAQCPETYRRLLLAGLRAGESIGQRTVYSGKYERPVRK
jgi:hypothetical protein